MITTPQIERRRKFLKRHIKIKKCAGLEIGPYDRPIVHKTHGPVKYLDYYSADELRAKKAGGRVPEEVVDLDYVMQGKGIGEVVTEKFDYVVASHVIEHVPNIIGWLHELSGILVDGGRIFLAVPDKRFTFDVARPLSTTGQIIQNHKDGKAQPSYGDVFDVHRYHKKVNPGVVWQGKFDAQKVPHTFDITVSDQQGRIALKRYFDCHCNVFTYERFLEIMADLLALSLIPFKVTAHQDNERPFNDFLCILKKV